MACWSGIRSIGIRNLAGTDQLTIEMTPTTMDPNGDDSSSSSSRANPVEEPPPQNRLVAVTGETGHGKSLLVSKAVDLVTGGKATAALLPPGQQQQRERSRGGGDDDTDASSVAVDQTESSNEATVQVVLQLGNPQHVAAVRQLMQSLDLDADSILGDQKLQQQQQQPPITLTLKRILNRWPNQRLKSTCYINHQPVTLKALKAIGEPLLTLVDATAAANALLRRGGGSGSSSSNNNSNLMAVLDIGVVSTQEGAALLVKTEELQTHYRHCRKERQRLEQELQQHQLSLPGLASSLHSNDDDDNSDKDVKLMQHWIDELDVFEERLNSLCRSVEERQALTVEEEEEEMDDEYWNENDDATERRAGSDDSALTTILKEIGQLEWTSNANSDNDENGFGSLLYTRLLDLSTHLKDLEDQIELVRQARESLASLSSPTSAQSAIERTRQNLLQAMSAGQDSAPAMQASEKAHGLLNELDNVLLECSRALEDDNVGLLFILEEERKNCAMITSEELAEHLAEWSRLSRKHGISPYLLPSCHASLRRELDGNLEAKTMLPLARKAEKEAFQQWQQSCQSLSKVRSEVAINLSKLVSRRLPSLGMPQSTFHVDVRRPKPTALSSNGIVGIDEVDFYLFHGDRRKINGSPNGTKHQNLRGGKLEQVASSGERARILLAMECAVPGAIRALSSGKSSSSAFFISCPPVAVIYDEIDAHVGGRASVAVGEMLMEQSHSCQVVSITHSPSIAATAGLHICVQKEEPLEHQGESARSHNDPTKISVQTVQGAARLQELARMASGDLATKEAKAFAEALIQHSIERRKSKPTEPPVLGR